MKQYKYLNRMEWAREVGQRTHEEMIQSTIRPFLAEEKEGAKRQSDIGEKIDVD